MKILVGIFAAVLIASSAQAAKLSCTISQCSTMQSQSAGVNFFGAADVEASVNNFTCSAEYLQWSYGYSVQTSSIMYMKMTLPNGKVISQNRDHSLNQSIALTPAGSKCEVQCSCSFN